MFNNILFIFEQNGSNFLFQLNFIENLCSANAIKILIKIIHYQRVILWDMNDNGYKIK